MVIEAYASKFEKFCAVKKVYKERKTISSEQDFHNSIL